MPDAAIRLRDVSKSYRLFRSQRQQLMEVLGLHRARPGTYKEFRALAGVSLEVARGARVGIIGRNGAGKTTLLKLVCGNFAPSAGEVEVNGSVQALMSTGLGFHPEETGRENALASLQYNGLTPQQYRAALEDILEFSELGEFIDQPFKTYSLGMQARLMFATSTAIRPDILIVDEVLGAGDAYFIAKSRQRMDQLVKGGCTLLLVSHSPAQVLEMCQEALWLDQGRIRMRGDAFSVVKAYEEFVHGSARVLSFSDTPSATHQPARQRISADAARSRLLQEPTFQPQAESAGPHPLPSAASSLKYQARGGVSRWQSDPGMKICGFDIVNRDGSTNQLVALQPAEIVLHLRAEAAGSYRLRYGIVVNDLQGRAVAKVFSPLDAFDIAEGGLRKVSMLLNPLQLGSGEYTVGISVLEYGPLELLNSTRRYDLLGRSFEFKVEVPPSLAATDCLFYHSAEWSFE
jgi:lipopolysaccharide transport system ATP-binding protein